MVNPDSPSCKDRIDKKSRSVTFSRNIAHVLYRFTGIITISSTAMTAIGNFVQNYLSVQTRKKASVAILNLLHKFSCGTLRNQSPLSQVVKSMWHMAHNMFTIMTSIGGIVYALYCLCKTNLSPYIFGRIPRKKPLETSLADLEAAVGMCVSDGKNIRRSLELMTNSNGVADLTRRFLVEEVLEIKSEINSLKDLLLNSNKFPPGPETRMSPISTEHKSEGESETEEEVSGSDISLD